VTQEEIEQLGSYVCYRAMPHGLSTRFKIILVADDGLDNKQIREKVGLSRALVGKWRELYPDKGLEGLHDELPPGRPRSVLGEKVAELIHKTLKSRPEGMTHWSIRTMANEIGISHMSVCRVWQTSGLKAHRSDAFKLFTDPFFCGKGS
jgi:putative transposase